MHKHHAEAMELTTKRTVFQGREHSNNLLVMTTARSATWCLSGPDLVPPEASHTYAQCFITDSCVTALEVFLAAQNNFWCRRQCCAPRRSRNCSAACSGMNSLESFERECQWIWTYSQVVQSLLDWGSHWGLWPEGDMRRFGGDLLWECKLDPKLTIVKEEKEMSLQHNQWMREQDWDQQARHLGARISPVPAPLWIMSCAFQSMFRSVVDS